MAQTSLHACRYRILALSSYTSSHVVGSLVGHTGSVECIGISSSYNWVATGGMDQKLIIWDLAHQSSRCTCEHDEGVTSLAWLGSSKVCSIRMHRWQGTHLGQLIWSC